MTFVDPGGDGFSTEPTYATEPRHLTNDKLEKQAMNEDSYPVDPPTTVFFKMNMDDFPALVIRLVFFGGEGG